VSTVAEVRAVLHGPFRTLAIGRFLDAIGSGLTMSLLVVYLAEVRGLPILTASLVLTWMAVVGLAAAPTAGTLTDRFGPRPVILVAILLEASGVALLSQVTTAPAAFAVATVMALGAAGIWGPVTTFTAQLVTEEQRPTAFAVGFMLLNLGLGMGGLIGAAIVDIDRPETFVLLYLADAATYLFAWVTVASLRGRGGRPAHRTDPGSDDETRAMHRQGWSTVLRDVRLRRQVAVSLLLLTCGYGSLEAGLAIFVTDTAQLPERIIGIVWLANTLTIVIGQLLVLRLLQGRSRTRVIGMVGLLWGASWLMLSVVPGVPVAPAIAILMVSTVVFALGETLWSPTAPALINAIAPDHLRGRYNSAQSLTWSLGASLAPVLSGLLIGAGRGVVWAVIVGLGCIGAAAFAQTLRPLLTPEEDGREPAAVSS
jgi:MFS family permease